MRCYIELINFFINNKMISMETDFLKSLCFSLLIDKILMLIIDYQLNLPDKYFVESNYQCDFQIKIPISITPI